jgi:hypothetical protein
MTKPETDLAKKLVRRFAGGIKWEDLNGEGPWGRQHWVDAAKELREELSQEQLYTGPVEVVEDRCSVCGMTESESGWGMFVDVRVVVAEGEEGFADITQLLCDEHLETVTKALMNLGFKDHRHGGVNYLEDSTCPGENEMDACPTPTEYGAVTIRHPIIHPVHAMDTTGLRGDAPTKKHDE